MNGRRTFRKVYGVLLLCLGMCLSSCATTASMQTFFVSSDVVQYFVPPEESKGGSYTLSLDITFRNDVKNAMPATVNFTLSSHGSNLGKALLLPESFVFLDVSGAKFETKELATVYVDSKRNAVRMTAKMDRQVFLELISKGPVSAAVGLENGISILFPLNKRTKKNLQLLHEEVAYTK